MQVIGSDIVPDFPRSTFATSSQNLQSSTPCHRTSTTAHASSDHISQIPRTDTTASIVINVGDGSSTSRGILIGLLSAFGSAGFAVLVLAIFFFFKYTSKGRILLDRIGRPGEFDDEQAFAREEAAALEEMDDMQKADYMRAKGLYLRPV